MSRFSALLRPNHPWLLALSGIFLTLAIALWTHTPIAVTNITVHTPQQEHAKPDAPASLTATLRYGLFQSGIIRISTGGCVQSLSINGRVMELPAGYAEQCRNPVLTLDLLPHLSLGDNQLRLTAEAKSLQQVNIRSLHPSSVLLSIGLCLLVYPTARLLLHGYRQRRAAGIWLRSHYREGITVLLLLLTAGWLRMQALDFVSADITLFLQHWMRHIRFYGLAEAYGRGVSNYAPLYTYLLGVGDFLLPLARTEHVIKYVSFVGEVIAAYWAYRIVGLQYRDQPHSRMPLAAALLLLLAPSVIVNGAVSAQCDIWFTAFLLGGSYYVLTQRPRMALIYAGIAFSLKPQVVFLFPVLLALLLKRTIPWRQLWIIPAVYVLTCVPAWLQGRPMLNMLKIYYGQVARYPINLNAANPYLYLRDIDPVWVINLGLLVAIFCGLIITVVSYQRWREVTPVSYMLLATLSAGLLPFTLPFMHDRYFFTADIFSLVLACMQPRWFLLAALFQAASLLAPPVRQFPYLESWTGLYHGRRLNIATALNALAIALAGWLCARHVWKVKSRR